MSSRSAGDVIRLKVPRRIEYRDAAVRLVAEALKLVRAPGDGAPGPRGDDRDFGADVVSAFGEAFSNAVLHGGLAGDDIEIEIEPGTDRLTIRIIDRGEPFDPSSVPQPRLETLPESGMGLFIMRSSMHDVRYASGSSGAPNVLTLTKRVGSFSRTDDGDATVLRIDGELDAVAAPSLRPVVDAIVADRRRLVTVDLSALRHIDSSGVGVLVSLYKRCHAFGGTVHISGARDQPLAIFRLLRLDTIFELT